jgi:hypothetical protein
MSEKREQKICERTRALKNVCNTKRNDYIPDYGRSTFGEILINESGISFSTVTKDTVYVSSLTAVLSIPKETSYVILILRSPSRIYLLRERITRRGGKV